MHAQSNCCNGGNRQQVGVSEDDPQSDPAHCEPYIHRIAHLAVGAYNHQALGGAIGAGVPCPVDLKVPNATQGNGESQHRRQGGEPAHFTHHLH